MLKFRAARVIGAFLIGILLVQLHACTLGGGQQAGDNTTLTIATVNNNDMVIMQDLSDEFEKAHPNIDLNWVVLEENVLRQRVTNDIANKGGQFDVMTIGTYETPIWAKQGWLLPLENLPAEYDTNDLLPPVKEALSYENQLYALPFYAESSMLYYRKDLFEQAGITVPDQPTYAQVREWADKINDPNNGVYGICLRGKPGWGENTAYFTTLVNTFGGKWFDTNWQPALNSPEWKEALNYYVDILKKDGPPGASSNGFNENLALFSTGKCGMWIDATVAAGKLADPKESQVADTVGFAKAPVAEYPNGSNWLWAWSLAVPSSTKSPEAAEQFIAWATSKEYVQLVAQERGWVAVPPGTRKSTYENPEYQKAAPFASIVLSSIESADPSKPTADPVPYKGIQFVAIPEFQALGTQVGQTLAAALTGQTSVDQALQQAQSTAEETMKRGGYIK
ncbi:MULTISPECIES: sugar ABC transporter substrate-binding protein [unclassified Leptolyngbya]|uniref:ABC transporter substrate-binding protein n=1 Tax=unclassified Leptolyngbya TaxID=2650499 RepID=UPI0016880B06|nr:MULTISPECIES: sugar ABC transporter substrate-binding protein [unclassified Leptolyngbya]MBD1909464.1 sugar ABC transporter substrate-binding protein [Leptolyngbya sp. FACHB-8]MBD2155639.1 sugar ABC transporter substrate-binding protein [Leptolyngbya sp. FACHB-16]